MVVSTASLVQFQISSWRSLCCVLIKTPVPRCNTVSVLLICILIEHPPHDGGEFKKKKVNRNIEYFGPSQQRWNYKNKIAVTLKYVAVIISCDCRITIWPEIEVKKEHGKTWVILNFEFYYFFPYKLCGIMVHCHHGSIHQLLGNQLLLGADATTHVLIITGSITIFSKNKKTIESHDKII